MSTCGGQILHDGSILAADDMCFWLGTHQPHWLADPRCADVPLFVSRRTLGLRKTLQRAVTKWALDSGGFTELQLYGQWTITVEKYAALVRRFHTEIGLLYFVAPMDWMCEPQVIHGLVEHRKHQACPVCKKAGTKSNGKTPLLRVLSLDADERPLLSCDICGYSATGKPPQINVRMWRAWAIEQGPAMAATVAAADALGIDAVVVFHGTGLSIEEHQRRTVANFLELRALLGKLVIPVLQGYSLQDYQRCIAMYEAAGVDLRAEPLVGVGTVCRRQGTAEATQIIRWIAAYGIRIHAFGFKLLGIEESACDLASGDSMAWSLAARHEPPMPGHDQPGDGRRVGHKNCANCIEYALRWYRAVRALIFSARVKKRQSEFAIAPTTAQQQCRPTRKPTSRVARPCVDQIDLFPMGVV